RVVQLDEPDVHGERQLLVLREHRRIQGLRRLPGGQGRHSRNGRAVLEPGWMRHSERPDERRDRKRPRLRNHRGRERNQRDSAAASLRAEFHELRRHRSDGRRLQLQGAPGERHERQRRPNDVQRLDSLSGVHDDGVRPDVLRAGALFLLTIAAYLPALAAGFIWDDDLIVADNPTLRSLGGLRDIWLGILHGGHSYPLTQYYPLTFTSFWLERHAWGVGTAAPFHLTNVLLHAASAIVLWRVL